jgi:hypothetical protein
MTIDGATLFPLRSVELHSLSLDSFHTQHAIQYGTTFAQTQSGCSIVSAWIEADRGEYPASLFTTRFDGRWCMSGAGQFRCRNAPGQLS